MKKSLYILAVTLMCFSVNCLALDKDVETDILTKRITTLIKEGKSAEALPYFEQLEGMGAKLPESFDYYYIETLDKAGQAGRAVNRGEEYLKKYGKRGKYYGQVIDVLARRGPEVAKSEKEYAEALAKYNEAQNKFESDMRNCPDEFLKQRQKLERNRDASAKHCAQIHSKGTYGCWNLGGPYRKGASEFVEDAQRGVTQSQKEYEKIEAETDSSWCKQRYRAPTPPVKK